MYSKEEEEENNMNYTIEWYRWYLANVGSQYLTQDEVLSISFRMQCENRESWYFAAMKKLDRIKKANIKLQYDCNTRARELGLKGEQLVFEALEQLGWDIIERPSLKLRPIFGQPSRGYDFAAEWQGSRLRLIEVKTIRDNCPFISIHFKAKIKLDKNTNPRHFSVFVWRNQIYYVRSINIRYLAGIPNYNQPHLNSMWIVDPSCLKVVSK